MSQTLNIKQCEVIINEGVINIVNMGRILNELKSSKNNKYEYKEIENIFLKKWGMQSSELDSIIKIFKKVQ